MLGRGVFSGFIAVVVEVLVGWGGRKGWVHVTDAWLLLWWERSGRSSRKERSR